MVKSIYAFFCFLFTVNLGFTQDPVLSKLSFDIKLRYDSAKVEFNNYEKKHGGFINTKNIKMHYLEWGNPKNIPLIWVHGSFTNSYELLGIAEDLVKHGYYLIAIDSYGHGLTKIPEHEVSLYHLADDINELLKVKKIKKAIIGGWSRGGITATAFYDAYPDKVLGLILEDGGSVSTNTHYHKLSPNELDKRVKDIFKDRQSYSLFNNEYEAYKSFYDYSSGGTQFERLAWLTVDNNKKWSIGIGVEKLFNMSNEKEFIDNILRPTQANLFGESMAIIEPKIVYRNLRVPMLILDPISDQDIFPYESENRELKNQHPTFITHKIYENTGHNIHNEKPKMFVNDLGTFLQFVKNQRTK
ncbi:MAG: alpha/beta hydrolase [Spirosomaceae bacterium]|jgi:pimeloyl-ACP methyl ester carboxylesterase|nr:alpha/beta hydrolase [Spirosomataceae bacterium]